MNRPAAAPPWSNPSSSEPLPLLREPDVSGLALWSALLMTGSVLLAFLSTDPAHAWTEAAAAPEIGAASEAPASAEHDDAALGADSH